MTHTIAVFVIIAVLCLAACTQGTILTTLTAVVDAAEVAIPIIAKDTGLSPAQIAQIESYLKLVSQFTATASTILAGTGTPAQKASAILTAAASIESGCNCTGLPSEVVVVIQAVEQAVAQFLTNFHTPAPPVVKVSPSNKAALTKLQARSETNAATAEQNKRKP